MSSATAELTNLVAFFDAGENRAFHVWQVTSLKGGPAAPVRFACAARFSEAVVTRGQDALVHLAGQVPENTPGAPIFEQTVDTLALIDNWLAVVGSDKSRILSATIYLTDLRSDYAGMNSAWDAWVPAGCAPARTTVGVTALANPQYRVEITVVASVKR